MSALEQSVTLEDVFSVVVTKRVPLAPELAGYLTLEIAEGAQASEGEVDPRSVFIGEEGSVALVRPKRENANGDAETSVRAILTKLLEASGSQTPALAAAARRKPSGGLPPLVAELEAALIPVNRSAGRRALARLAREVKRVTLGVGRNAAAPERTPSGRGSVPPPGPQAARSGPPIDPKVGVVSGHPFPPSPSASPAQVPAPAAAQFTPMPPTPDLPAVLPVNPLVRSITESTPEPANAHVESAGSASPPNVRPEPSEPFPDLHEMLPRSSVPPAPTPAPQVVSVPPPPPPVLDEAKPPPAHEPTPPPAPAREPTPPPSSVEEPTPPPSVIVAPTPPPAVSEPTPPPPATDSGAFTTSSEELAEHVPGPDEVDSLLAQFEVSGNTTDRAVSRELKAMVGLEPTPPPPRAPYGSDEAVDELLARDHSIPIANIRTGSAAMPPPAFSHSSAPPESEALQFAAHPTGSSAAPESFLSSSVRDASSGPPGSTPPILAVPSAPIKEPRALVAPPPKPSEPVRGARAAVPSARIPAAAPLPRELRTPSVPKLDRILMALTLLVALVCVAAVMTLKPGFFTGHSTEHPTDPLASAQPTSQAAKCRAVLTVTDVPPRAEVLVRHGQAPVDIEKMPVGARLELVATAEGFTPKRAIVPAGATWDAIDGKPRFEAAVQLDPAKSKTGVEPWPPVEPGSHVGGFGSPGTVHVISTPRGAEVWLLVGAAPEASIDQLKCDDGVDVLVAGPTTYRKRLHLSAADIAAAPVETAGPNAGAHTLKLSAH